MQKRVARVAPSRRDPISKRGVVIYRTPVSSPFGRIAIDWYGDASRPRVHRIILPSERSSRSGSREVADLRSRRGSCAPIDDLAERIQALCAGHPVVFDLTLLDLHRCRPFQRKVLLAEYRIPRGRVSTYGRIAKRIGHPGAARAVGSALAKNPFPLVIPCHRAIRETGALGGFRGGLAMKRALLELEGIAFSKSGRVVTDTFHY
jgi:methylated-DNA-[protein]-cysteine S-methyltransferase